MNPLTRIGRRGRSKVVTHAEFDWFKRRGGQAWLDKISEFGKPEEHRHSLCAVEGAGCRNRTRLHARPYVFVCVSVLAENKNWPDSKLGGDENRVGKKLPQPTRPGVSNLPVVKGGKMPVVPPLPVLAAFAPDGSDVWDGEAEDVDKDPDGYYTGEWSLLCAQGSIV